MFRFFSKEIKTKEKKDDEIVNKERKISDKLKEILDEKIKRLDEKKNIERLNTINTILKNVLPNMNNTEIQKLQKLWYNRSYSKFDEMVSSCCYPGLGYYFNGPMEKLTDKEILEYSLDWSSLEDV
jgi:uncharacterized protein YpuA (DUF1002 family)